MTERRILSRAECNLAAPRKSTPAPAKRGELYLHHTVTKPTADPCADWRAVQRIAFGRGFADISYTFGVHPNGTVLEGRAPATAGAHTENHNVTAHAIVLIGNYDESDPTRAAIDATRWLRAEMVRRGLLTPEHSFRPHSAVRATACPGARVRTRFAEFVAPYVTTPEEAMARVPNAVDACRNHDGTGVWVLARDGGVFTFGSAAFHGSYPALPAEHRQGDRAFLSIERNVRGGYDLAADDGALYSFP